MLSEAVNKENQTPRKKSKIQVTNAVSATYDLDNALPLRLNSSSITLSGSSINKDIVLPSMYVDEILVSQLVNITNKL